MLSSAVGRDIIGLDSILDQKQGAFQIIEAVTEDEAWQLEGNGCSSNASCQLVHTPSMSLDFKI